MSDNLRQPLAPGSTIGIMGGGQLGRMIALAGAQLGYHAVTFCESEEEPATHVCKDSVIAPYEDRAAQEKFISLVDVITFEFENVPADIAAYLDANALVRPSPEILKIAQDRILEKSFLNNIGIETAPWEPITDLAYTSKIIEKTGPKSIFKTARFGYDGKGQEKVGTKEELDAAWLAAGSVPAIVEGFVDFQCEISVIIARDTEGNTKCFDVVENIHSHHILDKTIAPARVESQIAEAATAVAVKIASALSLVGLIAVEMFVTKDKRIIVNEIAPRPHNSGHWTIDACITSQFEQLVRVVCGLPLGSTQRHSNALMQNLIGEDAERWHEVTANNENKLHLYGKKTVRSGRKMGHVTRLLPLSPDWQNQDIELAMSAMRPRT